MAPQEAINILDQVAATVTANRETHQQIAMALNVLRAAIEKPKAKS